MTTVSLSDLRTLSLDTVQPRTIEYDLAAVFTAVSNDRYKLAREMEHHGIEENNYAASMEAAKLARLDRVMDALKAFQEAGALAISVKHKLPGHPLPRADEMDLCAQIDRGFVKPLMAA